MPTYMLMIVDDPNREWASLEEAGQDMAKMGGFAQKQAQAGKLVGGGPLKGIAEAHRVRVQGGKALVTDGPFAETKEMLAGYFMIEAADMADAVEIAKECPHAEIGPVEVREVIVMGGGPPSE